MTSKRTFGPFLGVISSLNEKSIGEMNASDCLNVRLEDGTLRARYGWNSLTAAPTGFGGLYGLDFVKGYDDDYAPQEEYLVFEKRSAVLQPYSAHPLTLSRTVITNQGSGLSLGDGDWHGFAFDAKAYCYSVGGSAYVHDIGDYESWLPLDTARPIDPPIAPSISFYRDDDYNEPVTGSTTMSWSGAGSGVIDFFDYDTPFGSPSTLEVAFNSVDGDDLLLDLTWGVGGTGNTSVSNAELILDLTQTTSLAQDYSEVEEIKYEVWFEWASPGYTINMNGSLLDTHLINDDATDYNLFSDTTEIAPNTSAASGAYKYLVRGVFENPRFPDDWTVTEKLRLTWQNLQLVKTGGGSISYPATIRIRIKQIVPTGVEEPEIEEAELYKVKFGYSYYDESQDVESENVKESGWFWIKPQLSFFTGAASGDFLGNVPVMTVGDPAQDLVSHYRRFVWFDDEEVWRFVDEVAIGTDPIADDDYEDPWIQPMEYTYLELRTFGQRRIRQYKPIGEIKYGCAYNGSTVWLKRGGKNNVWISAVGNPRVPADPDYDLDGDFVRGRTFSMSPGFEDEPIWAGQAADALILLGQRGAYATTGTLPLEMTPPKRLPGSKGLYGVRAATRWTVGGDPGIAYVSNDLELWFASAYPGFDGRAGFRLSDLTLEIHGKIKSFLSPVVPDQLIVGADERGDSLWITYGNRAIVYRKPSLIDGKRQWEFYQYNRAWQLWSYDPYFGVRTASSSGHIDELEFDSSSSFVPIMGTTRDAGSEISEMYWQSKEFHDINRRISNVLAEREDMSDPVDIQVIADRSTHTQTIPANSRHTRFWIDSQGWNIKYRIELTDEEQVITKVIADENYPSSRQLNK